MEMIRNVSIKLRLLIIIFLIMIFGCRDSVDYYLGIPMQPEFNSASQLNGLNIFAIIRVDSIHGDNSSFVHVQKIMPAVGVEYDSLDIVIEDAKVHVYRMDNRENVLDTIEFVYNDNVSSLHTKKYVAEKEFSPKLADIFKIKCLGSDSLIAVGTAIVPSAISIDSLHVTDENMILKLSPDASVYMIDVFHVSAIGHQRIEQALFDRDNGMELKYSRADFDITKGSLHIYSYDKNLADYYSLGISSLNLNKYKAEFTTLDTGYGVFGAMNQKLLTLE